jgi:NAD(P)-dependent dehydrogenase (short-subunit alcohol dehydrogenase family)
MKQQWTVRDIPDQSGKTVVITGANSGIGYEAARALAQHGAHVVMACRDLSKGKEAAGAIRQEAPRGSVELLQLDLADLKQVRHFVEMFGEHHTKLDVLINNAGIMHIPSRQTADGFEMQFGVNHLGHFALTRFLLPTLVKRPQARVVTVSSFLHKSGKINFADLNATTNYDKYLAYSQAKVANVLFAFELQRKFVAHHVDAISVAAHPGYAATNLQAVGPQMAGSRLMQTIMSLANRLVAQSAAMGALPILYAATAPDVTGGEYFGPSGFREIRGYPVRVTSSVESQDQEIARRLWAVSEEMTGVNYEEAFATSRVEEVAS